MCDSNIQPEAARRRLLEDNPGLCGLGLIVPKRCRGTPLTPRRRTGGVGNVANVPTSLSVGACPRIYTRLDLIETAVLQP
jgi:hypothetical protein